MTRMGRIAWAVTASVHVAVLALHGWRFTEPRQTATVWGFTALFTFLAVLPND